MNDDVWEALVRRLDQEAKRNPGGYRRRVALLAVLGYAYVGGVVLLLLGVSAALVWLAFNGTWAVLKVLVPVAALVVIILRSLWVRFPPPEGIRLRRSDAQPLWRTVDDIRKQVDGPKVHALLLDGQLNAAIVQSPAWALSAGTGTT